ncbi:hypothetical protein H7F33_09490 [Pedobacter sp. PAMC26386]|nr:hypothetical protein H7F33_09490 [Pedobacter sp. PAMC26386]
MRFRTGVLLMFLVVFSIRSNAQAISFSPTRLFFKGNPGETLTETITISNSGKDPYEFITSIQDWKRDSLGNKVYFPMGTLVNSNGRNISLSSTNLKLNPGEKKSFTVSMLIPKTQKENPISSNSMLFFTQTNARFPQTQEKTGFGIRISLELGIQLFYIPNEGKSGVMNFLAFDAGVITVKGRNLQRLAVKFENTGEISKDGYVRFELTNKQTGEELKIKPIPIAIMPKDSQWVYYTMDNELPAGEYLGVAILDAGENYNLKVAERDIHVKK